MSSRVPCKFGAACRFNAQGTCRNSHAAAAEPPWCSQGKRCSDLEREMCRFRHPDSDIEAARAARAARAAAAAAAAPVDTPFSDEDINTVDALDEQFSNADIDLLDKARCSYGNPENKFDLLWMLFDIFAAMLNQTEEDIRFLQYKGFPSLKEYTLSGVICIWAEDVMDNPASWFLPFCEEYKYKVPQEVLEQATKIAVQTYHHKELEEITTEEERDTKFRELFEPLMKEVNEYFDKLYDKEAYSILYGPEAGSDDDDF